MFHKDIKIDLTKYHSKLFQYPQNSLKCKRVDQGYVKIMDLA
jgi:hypothetical protein